GRRARQLGSSPKAGMRELIDQNEILFARKHRNNAGICKVARSKYAGSVGSLEPRKPGLELAKQRMIAGDETRSARARAIALNCRYGRGFQRGMVGEIEIIVAGKGERAMAIACDQSS